MKNHSLYYEKFLGWKSPEEVFLSLYGKKEHTFWLDSSRVEKGLSRFSYMGEAKSVISYSLDSSSQDIFSCLSQQLEKIRVDEADAPFDFLGGFVGYFGYELKALCGYEHIYKSEYPDSLWYFVDRFLVFDHEKKEIYIACLTKDITDAKKWCQEIKNKINKLSVLQKTRSQDVESIELNLDRNKEQYLRDINVCKDYLKKGDSYEICLTNTIRTEGSVDSLDLYRVLRNTNPAPYAAYIKHGDFAVLCSSPERFLKIDQEKQAESKPIKGTVKRGTSPAEDILLAKSLQESEKNRAENLMIVDLVRNDLGRVCETGSVSVLKLMEIETYQTVHQLVSTIRGKLRKDISAIDCIKACFPGGSMTGAPKKRTLEIIDELEKKPRGVYSGALGFLSASGAVDLNIVIRTIVMNKNHLSLGAGGAIVDQSDAETEFDEMMLKAEALMSAITKASNASSYSMSEKQPVY